MSTCRFAFLRDTCALSFLHRNRKVSTLLAERLHSQAGVTTPRRQTRKAARGHQHGRSWYRSVEPRRINISGQILFPCRQSDFPQSRTRSCGRWAQIKMADVLGRCRLLLCVCPWWGSCDAVEDGRRTTTRRVAALLAVSRVLSSLQPLQEDRE